MRGEWTGVSRCAHRTPQHPSAHGALLRQRTPPLTATFVGNQVRLIGRADEWGGLADVYVDGVRQLVPIDCWNPSPRSQQVLYYKNGLANDSHTLRVVACGAGNPYSKGTRICVDALQFSAESAACSFPTGTGPTGPQRMIFGYPSRQDYRDAHGHLWRRARSWLRAWLSVRTQWPLAGGLMLSPSPLPAPPIPSSTATAATPRISGSTSQ